MGEAVIQNVSVGRVVIRAGNVELTFTTEKTRPILISRRKPAGFRNHDDPDALWVPPQLMRQAYALAAIIFKKQSTKQLNLL